MNILITGAGKRIGKEIAINFAKLGANIILHYNNSKTEANSTKKDIDKYGKAILIKANLENSKSVKKLFSDAKKKLGKIHHLINCASLFENDDLLKFNEKSWDKHININAKAPAILISIWSSVSAVKLVSPSASSTNSAPLASAVVILEALVANILIMSFALAAADNTTEVPLVAV